MRQVYPPASLTRPLDPHICDRLARAQREHYKIGVWASCGGPEVFAKTKPAARCLRCGRRRTITEPTDRLCGTCKRANADFDVDHRWSHLGGYDDDPYMPRW